MPFKVIVAESFEQLETELDEWERLVVSFGDQRLKALMNSDPLAVVIGKHLHTSHPEFDLTIHQIEYNTVESKITATVKYDLAKRF